MLRLVKEIKKVDCSFINSCLKPLTVKMKVHESSSGPSMFKHWLCGLNFVVGFVSVCWATGETLPSKWSMPDHRGGPQNALNVFLWGWVKPDPQGSACLHKEDCVHINITVASGPGTY